MLFNFISRLIGGIITPKCPKCRHELNMTVQDELACTHCPAPVERGKINIVKK